MKFTFYRESNGDHHWRLTATNGKKVANGGEGYRRVSSMLKTLQSVFGGSPKRVGELNKALWAFEKENGELAKPFAFIVNP